MSDNGLPQQIQSFNTQPPEGGWMPIKSITVYFAGFNTQPPEGGWLCWWMLCTLPKKFQHTAARRRLVMLSQSISVPSIGFNTQPPEGGWI